MGIGCRLPVPDTRPKIWTVVWNLENWIPTPAPPSAKTKTLSRPIAVRLLSYDAAGYSLYIPGRIFAQNTSNDVVPGKEVPFGGLDDYILYLDP